MTCKCAFLKILKSYKHLDFIDGCLIYYGGNVINSGFNMIYFSDPWVLGCYMVIVGSAYSINILKMFFCFAGLHLNFSLGTLRSSDWSEHWSWCSSSTPCMPSAVSCCVFCSSYFCISSLPLAVLTGAPSPKHSSSIRLVNQFKAIVISACYEINI